MKTAICELSPQPSYTSITDHKELGEWRECVCRQPKPNAGDTPEHLTMGVPRGPNCAELAGTGRGPSEEACGWGLRAQAEALTLPK